MYTDSRGHRLTTDSAQAAADCRTAIDMFVQRRIDVMPMLQQSMQADPHCAFTQASFGLMLHGARNTSLNAQISTALDTARAHDGNCTKRERQYIDALQCAHNGDLLAMLSCYEQILQENPTDLLALVLAQGELFWLGDMQYANKLSAMVHPHWHEDITGYAEFLSVRAFDLEETGHYQNAEKYGRQSVDLEPDNAWGTHAVAHVMLMQGRHRDGINWLSDKQSAWSQTNQIKFHIWWHQCLFHIECAEHDAALEHYDNHVRNRNDELVVVTPDLYIDMQNGASLLWRLEHAGVDVGNRWHELAELASGRLEDMTSPFTSAHYAVILAATGEFTRCQELVDHMQTFAQANNHTLAPRYSVAAIPAAIGAIAHRKAKYQDVLNAMLPHRQTLWQMGGSHAQQDLFYQILVDAAVKLQQKQTTAMLLHEIEALGFSEPAQYVAYNAAGQLLS